MGSDLCSLFSDRLRSPDVFEKQIPGNPQILPVMRLPLFLTKCVSSAEVLQAQLSIWNPAATDAKQAESRTPLRNVIANGN